MPHVPDATTKYAFHLHPRVWLMLAGLPVPPTDAGLTIVDPTLSTVSMTADKLVRIEIDGVVYLVHVEFQTSRDADFDWRMLRYNIWARHQYALPVRSVAFLFHRRAAPTVTGRVYDRADDHSSLEFRYRVVRLWELPVEPLLTGPIGTVPLAVLAAVPRAGLKAVVDRVAQRAVEELPRAEVRDLAEVVFVFVGIRVKGLKTVEAIMGTFNELLEDSVTYQAIRQGEARGEARGEAIGRQATILDQGTDRFGPPSGPVVERIRGTTDVGQLQSWSKRVLTVDGWETLVNG